MASNPGNGLRTTPSPDPTASDGRKSIAAIPSQFPPSFNIYSQAAFTRTYLLGENKDKPVYALKFHTGISGQPQAVLHTGPDDSSPPLATLDYADLRSPMTVTLPAAAPGRAIEEIMDHRMTFPYLTYFFSVDVGSGGGGHREDFEWRHSSGGAVASLRGSKAGWKLVRMVHGPSEGDADGAKPAKGDFATSDGREVVAALAYGSGKGAAETAKFAFLGEDQSKLLGERWAVMAVMTALGIFQRDRGGWRR